jgi:hypothetical protein
MLETGMRCICPTCLSSSFPASNQSLTIRRGTDKAKAVLEIDKHSTVSGRLERGMGDFHFENSGRAGGSKEETRHRRRV